MSNMFDYFNAIPPSVRIIIIDIWPILFTNSTTYYWCYTYSYVIEYCTTAPPIVKCKHLDMLFKNYCGNVTLDNKYGF